MPAVLNGDRFRDCDEWLAIEVVEEGNYHADPQGEPLSGPLRAAARVRLDGLECEIRPESEIETGVFDRDGHDEDEFVSCWEASVERRTWEAPQSWVVFDGLATGDHRVRWMHASGKSGPEAASTASLNTRSSRLRPRTQGRFSACLGGTPRTGALRRGSVLYGVEL